jgi:hypothetical protein
VNRTRPLRGLVFGGLALLLVAGCAKSPTGVLATVYGHDMVPRVAVIRATITLSGGGESSSDFRSPRKASVEDAGPADFLFPAVLQLGVPASWTGPAEVKVEALDWQTMDVLGRGTTTVMIVRDQRVPAEIRLAPVAPTPGDGGTDGAGDDAAGDGAAGDDAASDDAAPDSATDA